MFFIYQNPLVVGATIIEVDSPEQTTTLALGLGLVPGEYGVFANLSGLPSDWQLFPQGVTFTPGPSPSYGYNITGAKYEASVSVKLQNATAVGLAVNNYSSNLLASQAILPAGDRLPGVVAAMAEANALGETLQVQLDAIAASTSISDLNNIVNPPTGILSTGRGGDGDGPLDLNNSVYTEFNSATLTESETELYIPGTSIILVYGAVVPNGFTSNGNCFVLGDYRVQIREAATSYVLAEFECPLAVSANVDVPF